MVMSNQSLPAQAIAQGRFASFSARVSLLIAVAVLTVFFVAVAILSGQSVRNGSAQAARLILLALQAADQAQPLRSSGELPKHDDAAQTLASSEVMLRWQAPIARRRMPAMATQIQQALVDRVGAQRVRVAESARGDRRAFDVWMQSAKQPELWLGLPMEPNTGRISAMALSALMLTAFIVFFAARWLARMLIHPIEALTAQAPAIVAGRDVPTIGKHASPEVHELANALQLAARAQAQIARERELMLVGISHDLRTPIARLRMALAIDRSDDRDLILADVLELEGVVNGFLSSARSELQEPQTEIELCALISSMLATRSSQWRLIGNGPVFASLPVASFKRVISNLLDNAECHGQPPLIVQLWRSHGWLHIDVNNAGTPIPAEVRADPMRPFKASASGQSGMGIAIAARLASRFSGVLEFGEGASNVSVRVKWPG